MFALKTERVLEEISGPECFVERLHRLGFRGYRAAITITHSIL